MAMVMMFLVSLQPMEDGNNTCGNKSLN